MDPFMEDLFRQSPVKHNSCVCLGGLVFCATRFSQTIVPMMLASSVDFNLSMGDLNHCGGSCHTNLVTQKIMTHD